VQKQEGEMKFTKALAGVLFLTIVFAGAVAVEAAHLVRHQRSHHMMGPGIYGLKTMIQLNLSDSQESKILSIIEKYENERVTLKRRLREARETFTTLLQNETFSEDEVRSAFQRSASIKEELLVSRLKMMAEIRTVLTPEQRQMFQEFRSQRMKRAKARNGRWIEQNNSK
jgi:Spy/CpxP family protein refolding chaperone